MYSITYRDLPYDIIIFIVSFLDFDSFVTWACLCKYNSLLCYQRVKPEILKRDRCNFMPLVSLLDTTENILKNKVTKLYLDFKDPRLLFIISEKKIVVKVDRDIIISSSLMDRRAFKRLQKYIKSINGSLNFTLMEVMSKTESGSRSWPKLCHIFRTTVLKMFTDKEA